jgi:hypothetical protein
MDFFTQFKPSEISKLCDTNLDLSFPRTPFSVLYFPTMYERTRLAGEAESEFTNDMPIKFPGASASSDQGERPLETAPSVAQETDNNPLKDPRTLTKSNDNTLLQPTLAWSSCDPHLWPHVSFAPIIPVQHPMLITTTLGPSHH